MPRSAGRSWPLPPRWLIAVAAAIVGLGIGIGLWATGASAVTGYRTATAATATVTKTLEVTGAASAVHQAAAEFQVDGTVSAVDVSLNQRVTAGETLASLRTTALEKDLSSAQTTLTAAEAKLSEDESSQSSSSSTSSDTSSSTAAAATASTTTTTTTTTAPSGTGPSSSTTALAKAQQAVVSAQQTADNDAATADAALKEAQTACSSPSTGTTPSTGPSTTPTTKPSTKPATSPPASTASTSGAATTAACLGALAKAQSAQQQVQTDQAALAKAETTLAKLLSSSSNSSSSPGAGTGSAGASGSGSKTGGSGGSATTPSSGTSTKPTSGSNPNGGGSATGNDGSTASDSAAQLASDQASIDSAKASLIKAQQNLADAQLTTPISGTVAAVSLSAGQSVSAGSATDAITIVNSGSFQATAILTPTQANEVKVGDATQVTVTGTGGTLDGTVARVGPVDTSSSSYTYPLVVALPAGSHGIASGSAAQLTVTLAEAKNVEVVPTSTVHTTGAGSYVEVIKTGQAARQVVQVGVVGAEYTQITSGLSSRAEVVLADLSQAVPSSSTTTSSSSGLLGGGGGRLQVGGSFPGGGRFTISG